MKKKLVITGYPRVRWIAAEDSEPRSGFPWYCDETRLARDETGCGPGNRDETGCKPGNRPDRVVLAAHSAPAKRESFAPSFQLSLE